MEADSIAAPLVGVTTYAPDERGRFHLPREYVDAVRRAGGIPLLLPPGERRWREALARIDALVLTGGGDVDPAFYDDAARHVELYGVDRERDELELELVREARRSERPLLAICRGCQVVNVALGGTLIQHLPDEVGDVVPHRDRVAGSRTNHAVEVSAGSKLEQILGGRAHEPSSSHHQAIRRLANGLEVTARAGDGTVEAVELPAHPFFVAVQWHPEHTAATDRAQQRLFDALVVAAQQR
ncbi:MAG TPA: gamma-glutamyl-gamma-aminobutyrate hydrolase family protein [Planctomycetota bacterium]|nr:gamma-glutamyl-gamma-aminobutyrate hydrolase family protein [Planctomycetota bacterium]